MVSQVSKSKTVNRALTINTAKGHTGTSTDKSRECLAVGSNNLTTLSRVGLLLVEVEDEVRVVWEQSETINGTEKSVSVLNGW